jgi:hypothetical protein
VQQGLYSAENSNSGPYTKIAGGRICGFSGDGGQATGAEIGNRIGQMAFDLAGNLYFADTANNRVRRIDNYTGIITTVAGNGAAGQSGNSGPATAAAVGAPSGIAVDSQGQIYILTVPAPGTHPTSQVVRKVANVGALAFAPQAKGKASAPLILQVANTGNADLTLNAIRVTGDTADFKIDPNSTSCSAAAGRNSLANGRNCQIGIVFKPAAVGNRVAVLKLIGNTVNAVSTARLTGKGQ